MQGHKTNSCWIKFANSKCATGSRHFAGFLERKETQDNGRDCKYSGCGFKWLHNTRLSRRGWWVLVTWLYLGKNSVTPSTTNPVWTALGSNTGFRGKVQRLSTTSVTRTYVYEGVFIRGVRKIEKNDYYLRHVCPSVHLLAWNNSAPTGRIFMKFDTNIRVWRCVY
jgi:hypothetical protein